MINLFVLTVPAVFAFQELSIKGLPNRCSSYPSYNATSETAGPWKIIADSTASTFDGFNVSAAIFTNNGVDRFGFVCILPVFVLSLFTYTSFEQ